MLFGLKRFKKKKTHWIFEIWQECRSRVTITWSCSGIRGRMRDDEMSRTHCKSSAAGPEKFPDLESRPLRRNIMFQPSYSVNKLFNRTVTWYFTDRLGCWNWPYLLFWCNLRELAGTFALQIVENIHNFKPGQMNYDFIFGFVHLHKNEKSLMTQRLKAAWKPFFIS